MREIRTSGLRRRELETSMGVYRLRAGQQVQTRKLLLLR